MRTNDESIARRLTVPSQVQAISQVRPDIVMLRTMAAALVMFDSIGASREWLNRQVPRLLREHSRSRTSSNVGADTTMLMKVQAVIAVNYKCHF